jgi:Xaa-Pro aminopeptidase
MTEPAPFTADDYAERMARTGEAARVAGLDGVLVTPGPDLVWLTGYRPTAITERLTLLILAAGRDPALIVPVLERADAAKATGADALSILDWRDGDDPYAVSGRALAPEGRYGVSDSTWSLHLLGLQRSAPGTGYRALTDCLPMLRAAKDAHELDRLDSAGSAADAAYEQILTVPFAGCTAQVTGSG